MEITHTQVRRLVSKDYYSTESRSISTASRQRETVAVCALSAPFLVLLLFVSG
jgi:hypothetical protein